MERYEFALVTDADGDGDDSQVVLGAKLLYAIEANDGTLDDGHTLVLTCTRTSGVTYTLWSTTAGDTNSDAIFYPRVVESDQAANALTTYALNQVEGTLTLTVADGGNTKTGAAAVYLMEI